MRHTERHIRLRLSPERAETRDGMTRQAVDDSPHAGLADPMAGTGGAPSRAWRAHVTVRLMLAYLAGQGKGRAATGRSAASLPIRSQSVFLDPHTPTDALVCRSEPAYGCAARACIGQRPRAWERAPARLRCALRAVPAGHARLRSPVHARLRRPRSITHQAINQGHLVTERLAEAQLAPRP